MLASGTNPWGLHLQFYQSKAESYWTPLYFGGDGGNQTPGLTNANRALYQLSYIPLLFCHSRGGGNPEKLNQKTVGNILPVGIAFFNKIKFPLPIPLL
jgi:hypothetical protein